MRARRGRGKIVRQQAVQHRPARVDRPELRADGQRGTRDKGRGSLRLASHGGGPDDRCEHE